MKQPRSTLLTIACFLIAHAPGGATDYQKLADEMPWKWDGQQASLIYSITQHLTGFNVEILCPKWDGPSKPRLKVRIKDDAGKEIHSFEAHAGTVFTAHGGTIYMAEYHVRSTGCSVTAYNLKEGKQLWKTRLESRYRRPYSAFHNAVTIEDNGEAILVRGNEGLFRYVEYLDMKTGKTLAKREYPVEGGPNPAPPRGSRQ
jgi:hypothetical protein